jgi:hypothetical protein
MCSFPH